MLESIFYTLMSFLQGFWFCFFNKTLKKDRIYAQVAMLMSFEHVSQKQSLTKIHWFIGAVCILKLKRNLFGKKMKNLNIFLAVQKHKLRFLEWRCLDKFKTIFNFKCFYFGGLKMKLEKILKESKPSVRCKRDWEAVSCCFLCFYTEEHL